MTHGVGVIIWVLPGFLLIKWISSSQLIDKVKLFPSLKINSNGGVYLSSSFGSWRPAATKLNRLSSYL
jgi:hypothetical protein